MTEPELTPLTTTGEQLVPKRCAFCGATPTVLAWRPLEPVRVSSPMNQPAWESPEPMRTVVDAKLTCKRCGVTGYGWLVGGPGGAFVVLSGRETVDELVIW